MARRSIDIEKLADLFDEGLTGGECAKYFGVTPAAISKAKKRLTRAVIRHTATEKAPEIVDKTLATFEQLTKINENANELLDLCMAWTRGDSVAIQVMESKARQLNVGTRDEPEWVTEFKYKDPTEVAVKLMGEIRHQLDLQAKIFKQLYEFQEVRLFMDLVLETLRRLSPELRDEFVTEFKRRKLIRSAFSLH